MRFSFKEISSSETGHFLDAMMHLAAANYQELALAHK